MMTVMKRMMMKRMMMRRNSRCIPAAVAGVSACRPFSQQRRIKRDVDTKEETLNGNEENSCQKV